MTIPVYELATMTALCTIRGETRTAVALGLVAPKAGAEVCVACENLEQKLRAAIEPADATMVLGREGT